MVSQTTKADGVLGVWVNILGSPIRHLVAVVRKARQCRCGCNGWCTIWCLLNWLRWSFLRAALKVFPSETPEVLIYNCDNYRAALAGLALQSAFNLIGIKGDWQEFCSTLAFAPWNTVMSPCLFCLTTKADMFNIDRWDVLQEPH